jgi:hypothetical protein
VTHSVKYTILSERYGGNAPASITFYVRYIMSSDASCGAVLCIHTVYLKYVPMRPQHCERALTAAFLCAGWHAMFKLVIAHELDRYLQHTRYGVDKRGLRRDFLVN